MKVLKHLLVTDVKNLSLKEKLLSGFSAFVAIALLGYLSLHTVGPQGFPYLIASIGAASVLVFAVPHSPLSQPWPLVGGHIVSALIGVLCRQYIDSEPLAAAVAVGAAIFAMHVLRCLHPPGGAAALGAVLGGSQVEELGLMYVLIPVTSNAIMLAIIAIILNRLTGLRRYPAQQKTRISLSTQAAQWALGPPRFKEQDLQQALQEMDAYIDVSTSDLARIYALAVMSSNKRRLGEVTCKDIMTENPLTLPFDTELGIAWQTLHDSKIKAVPVVDNFKRPLGMVTRADFMHHATLHPHGTLGEKLARLLHRTPGQTSDKAETVGQIMSSPVVTVKQHQHIVDVIPIFTEKGIHHLPILDDDQKVCGMITRSDVMRAMLLTRS